ncbi:MAG TPA: homoserine O-acetyltransferase [Flavisolibacter sp.]|nr:homoserine O-acetyltransferase [Flavisolibacter sp.]
MTETFVYKQPFTLESGIVLHRFQLAYSTWGTLNKNGDNAVWVFHALTANSDAADWWSGLVGDEKFFEPQKHFIICVNMPGSCYGSLSPLDLNTETGEPFYHRFPVFTPRDMIRAYQKLKEKLGITKLFAGIGGSMGGQQLLEWAIEEPGLFEHIIPIATNAQHSPWGIAFNAAQRFCMEGDSSWKDQHPDAGNEGMKTARAIALLSYRNYTAYSSTQQGWQNEHGADGKWALSKAETYQRYQGEKLAKRFTAFSYYFLSQSMDLHDVGRGRGGLQKALAQIQAKTLVVSISSDILFPCSEQQQLAQLIPGAVLKTIDSPYGHDGFLLEFEKLTQLLTDFLPVRKVAEKNISTNININV